MFSVKIKWGYDAYHSYQMFGITQIDGTGRAKICLFRRKIGAISIDYYYKKRRRGGAEQERARGQSQRFRKSDKRNRTEERTREEEECDSDVMCPS